MLALSSAPRRIKLLLEYSGTRYHGWQLQPNAVTVQGTLEACLARMTNSPVRLHAAGRTDAGVHALGQVVHFDTASTIALPALVRGANSLLPSDIVVRQAEDVPLDFHARYSARRKTYAYIVHNHSIPSAFRAASCTARQPWRCLFCLRIVRHAERLVFVLNADGFLQHMARTIVGTLVAIGRAQLPADVMAAILHSGQRQYAGPTAPAHGLFLVRVVYDTDATVRA